MNLVLNKKTSQLLSLHAIRLDAANLAWHIRIWQKRNNYDKY